MYKKIFLSVFLAAAGLCFFGGPARAAGDHLLLNYYLQQGKMYYDEGQKRDAIRAFSKALLVDSSSKEAKGYLKKMGLSGGIYGYGTTPTDQIGQMADSLVDYQQTVDRLHGQVHSAHQLAMEQQAALDEAARKAAAQKKLTEHMGQEIKAHQETIQELEQSLKEKISQIVALNTSMYKVKQDLVDKLNTIKSKNGRIKNVSSEVDALEQELRNTERRWKENRIAYERKLFDLQHDFDLYQNNTNKTADQKNAFIAKLRDSLYRQMAVADSSKNEAVFNQYKLMNRDTRLRVKDAQIARLKDMLVRLQQGAASLQAQVNTARAANGPQGENVNQAALIEGQDNFIAALKDKLVDARNQIRQLERYGGEESHQRIIALQQKLDGLNQQLTEKELALKEKEKGSTLLKARLKDTQQRLKLVEQLVDEKDNQIQQLEKQLSELIKKINSKPLKIE